MENQTTEIGQKIRQKRKEKGYSQEYLAKKMRMSQNNYSKIEKGEIRLTIERVSQIADLLNISPLDILPFGNNNVFNNCTNSGNFNSYIINDSDLIKQLAASYQSLSDTWLKLHKNSPIP